MNPTTRNHSIITAVIVFIILGIWFSFNRFETIDDEAARAYNQAVGLYMQHNFWGAENQFRCVAKDYPNSQWGANAQMMLCSVLMNQNRDTEAIHEAERLAIRYRGSYQEPYGWELQGKARRRCGQLAAARENFRWCFENFPEHQAGQTSQVIYSSMNCETESINHAR